MNRTVKYFLYDGLQSWILAGIAGLLTWVLARYIQQHGGKPRQLEETVNLLIIGGSIISVKVTSLLYSGRVVYREEQILTREAGCEFRQIDLSPHHGYVVTLKPLIWPLRLLFAQTVLPSTASFRYQEGTRQPFSLCFHVSATIYQNGAATHINATARWPKRRKTILWMQRLRDVQCLSINVALGTPRDSTDERQPETSTNSTRELLVSNRNTPSVERFSFSEVPILLTVRCSLLSWFSGWDRKR